MLSGMQALIQNMEVDGAQVNAQSLISVLLAIANAAQGNVVFPAQIVNVANAAGVTLNATTLGGAIFDNLTIVRSGAAAVSDTTDTAAHIVAAIPNPAVGQIIPITITNLNSDTLTLVAGTGITLAGTTTVATDSTRYYQGVITALGDTPAITLTGYYTIAGASGA